VHSVSGRTDGPGQFVEVRRPYVVRHIGPADGVGLQVPDGSSHPRGVQLNSTQVYLLIATAAAAAAAVSTAASSWVGQVRSPAMARLGQAVFKQVQSSCTFLDLAAYNLNDKNRHSSCMHQLQLLFCFPHICSSLQQISLITNNYHGHKVQTLLTCRNPQHCRG
jgi:hypothetical protein